MNLGIIVVSRWLTHDVNFMKSKKIVLTGGHITPAMALIEVLKKHGWDIYYFGRTKAMEQDKSLALEAEVIPKLGVKFLPLTSGRFRRKITLRNLYSMLKFPIGIVHAILLLIKVKPDVVVSFGGYLLLPAVIAAWVVRIPIIIHEQISVAGLANKLSGLFATKIAVTFPSSKQYYPKEKVVLTGNPIQTGVFKTNKIVKKTYSPNFRNIKTIFVTGGNQGARDLNRLVLKALPELLKKYNVIHQIGSTEAQDPEWEEAQNISLRRPEPIRSELFESEPQSRGPHGRRLVSGSKGIPKQVRNDIMSSYYPVRFIPHEEMGSVYGLADLVVSRSGANTISELGALNKPALVVPLEPSLMDEQLHNAKLLENAGLAIMKHEDELTSDTLINQTDEMFEN